MSESIRQSNLFSAEDYRKVFKSFSFVDYTAYDFNTLKQAMLNYIQTYYPEDFNDYIESSEFIAIVELLAYLGTSLAFRTELNSRENFIDTAERRESIIRLAQMVNYVPRRNIPASGLFKISAVQTNQPLTDAEGAVLNDFAIYWNDPNNPNWFDQFVQVCNAAFSPLNPFGRPTKSGTIGGIPTDLYQLNNILKLNVTYPVTVNVNGQTYPVDVCNPDIITNESIFERHPDPAESFNFIYRNDSLGVGSANSGFFLFFKQGNLINIDSNFEFPVPNRTFTIDVKNINQDDVYIQETDESGNVLSKWTKVPALAGENIIYNSIKFSERNIFDVISGANDTVTIRFADGNFGNVPTGLFRAWVRSSANQALVIRPEDAQSLQINIPYIGANQQEYVLRIIFSLESTSANAAAAETDDQIKLRAPEVFSTQSRMVNGSDYNVLPLIYGNQIAKIQAINRTYSGQSRYVDIGDPTGFHKDLLIFGEDGALFRDNKYARKQVLGNDLNSINIENIIFNTIQEMIRDSKVSNFFYDEYIPQFEENVRINARDPGDPADTNPIDGYSLLDFSNPNIPPLYWKPVPVKYKNYSGYFANTDSTGAPAIALVDIPLKFISTSSIIEFANPSVITSANNVVLAGIPVNVDILSQYASAGPVQLGDNIQVNSVVKKSYPPLRTTLNSAEITEITQRVTDGTSFFLYYNLVFDEWKTSITPFSDSIEDIQFIYPAPQPGDINSVWGGANTGIVYVTITADGSNRSYDVVTRGRVYVFESYKDARFYWEPKRIIIDGSTNRALRDKIEILPFINTNSTVDNNLRDTAVVPGNAFLANQLGFVLSDVYIQEDGYQDTAKVEISLLDSNQDGVPDDPDGFSRLVTKDNRIVFEYYTNGVAGYQSTRPWKSRWSVPASSLHTDASLYYVHVPTDVTRSPFISNAIDEASSTDLIYLGDNDLLFVNNLPQLEHDVVSWATAPLQSIANQLTAFLNGTDTATPGQFTTFTWLTGTDTLLRATRKKIITDYFTNKVFLIDSISPPGYGVYYKLRIQDSGPSGYPFPETIVVERDLHHFDRNGKVFTQNLSIPEVRRIPLHFKWSHYSPVDQRVDPAPTNIIDIIAITDNYYRDVLIWKNSNSSLSTFPVAPSTEELRIQFQDLNKYKMVSDTIVWNSGTFKLLFGAQAAPELRAMFKVVKSGTSNISDNEIKTRVVRAIDTYFDIRNWDFGEKFFYTELAAFIHQQLSNIISSIVIVPNNARSQFGNLFEIVASPNEIFLSTATVNNVSIVANLSEQNLRSR